jgi:hypothetical protein
MAHTTRSRLRGKTEPGAFALGGEQFVETATKASMAGFESAGRLQAEAMRFVADRLAKDFEMPARFARCRSLGGVLEEQWNYAATMVKDYGEESRRMFELMAAARPWDGPGKREG